MSEQGQTEGQLQVSEQEQAKGQTQENKQDCGDGQSYVDKAESVIESLIKESAKDKKGRPKDIVTTSKLRGLLSMSADIYNEVINQPGDRLSRDTCARIDYLRVRFLYEAGKEESVRNLIEEAGILKVLKEIDGSKKKYIDFSRYMEALVAFRKYLVGKDE